jgi:hypothetical protein
MTVCRLLLMHGRRIAAHDWPLGSLPVDGAAGTQSAPADWVADGARATCVNDATPGNGGSVRGHMLG